MHTFTKLELKPINCTLYFYKVAHLFQPSEMESVLGAQVSSK